MLKSAIPFYLFLPTLVAWFGAYSFARFHDLKWGNRPSDSLANLSEEVKKKLQQRFRKQSYVVTALIVIFNVLLALFVEQNKKHVVVISALVFFTFFFALLQMLLSFVYRLLTLPPLSLRTLWGCLCPGKRRAQYDEIQ